MCAQSAAEDTRNNPLEGVASAEGKTLYISHQR